MAAALPIDEALAVERDPSRTLRSFPRAASRVRHVLLTKPGEYRVADLTQTTKATRALVVVTMAEMKTLGFRFAKRPAERRPGDRGRQVFYRLTNASHVPTAAQVNALRKRRAAMRGRGKGHGSNGSRKPSSVPVRITDVPGEVVDDTPRRQPSRRRDNTLPPTPTLGETVEVWALTWEDDGTVRVGLRNEAHAWLLEVTGHSLRGR